jgi:hypothetical protein
MQFYETVFDKISTKKNWLKFFNIPTGEWNIYLNMSKYCWNSPSKVLFRCEVTRNWKNGERAILEVLFLLNKVETHGWQTKNGTNAKKSFKNCVFSRLKISLNVNVFFFTFFWRVDPTRSFKNGTNNFFQ